jgi:hypothetical protein
VERRFVFLVLENICSGQTAICFVLSRRTRKKANSSRALLGS